jgi:hypothetical protein
VVNRHTTASLFADEVFDVFGYWSRLVGEVGVNQADDALRYSLFALPE